MSKRTQFTWAGLAVAILYGLIYAFIIAALAFGMLGAGHGWTSTFVTTFALLLIPMASAGAAFGETPFGKFAVGLALLGGLIVDGILFVNTQAEGFGYVKRVWDAMPLFLIIWASMWLMWQLMAIGFFVKSIVQTKRDC